YTPVGSGRAAFFEGCLSVPGYQAVVARPTEVRLTGQDEHGRALDEVFSGWPARIVQHETDHLDGTLYLDRAEPRSLSSQQAVADRWAQPSPERAARALGFDLPRRPGDRHVCGGRPAPPPPGPRRRRTRGRRLPVRGRRFVSAAPYGSRASCAPVRLQQPQPHLADRRVRGHRVPEPADRDAGGDGDGGRVDHLADAG